MRDETPSDYEQIMRAIVTDTLGTVDKGFELRGKIETIQILAFIRSTWIPRRMVKTKGH